MKFIKIICAIFLMVGMVACSSKADDGAKYVGHWVEKTKNDGVTAALDITDEGNGNYVVTEWQRDILGGGDKLTKTGGASSTIKNGTLLVGGVAPAIIKNDGSLFYVKEYVR